MVLIAVAAWEPNKSFPVEAIFDGVTDEELTDDEVIVKDVTDDKARDNDLSDSEEPEEITATPAYVQWDPNRL